MRCPKMNKPEPVAWELRAGATDKILLEITNNAERAHNHQCSWFTFLSAVPLYGPDLMEAYEKSEAECAALREELRKQAAEAYADVEAWGAYASEYFAQKWDLEGDLKKWSERAAIKEPK